MEMNRLCSMREGERLTGSSLRLDIDKTVIPAAQVEVAASDSAQLSGKL